MLTVKEALAKLSVALDGDIPPGIPPLTPDAMAKKINKALQPPLPEAKPLAVKMADSASAIKLLLKGGIKSEPHLVDSSASAPARASAPEGSAPSVASLILGLQGNPEMQQKLLATVNPRLHAIYNAITGQGGK